MLYINWVLITWTLENSAKENITVLNLRLNLYACVFSGSWTFQRGCLKRTNQILQFWPLLLVGREERSKICLAGPGAGWETSGAHFLQNYCFSKISIKYMVKSALDVSVNQPVCSFIVNHSKLMNSQKSHWDMETYVGLVYYKFEAAPGVSR